MTTNTSLSVQEDFVSFQKDHALIQDDWEKLDIK